MPHALQESFNFGWVTTSVDAGQIEEYKTFQHPVSCYWSGYAGTHVRYYPEDDSFIVIGIQIMDHSFTGAVDAVRADRVVK
jgi:hypothetical protein